AESPAVMGIARADAQRAVVTVRVRVTPYLPVKDQPSTPPASTNPPAPTTVSSPDHTGDVASASGGDAPAWHAAPARWLDVAVPVGVVGGRLAVTQRPAMVG